MDKEISITYNNKKELLSKLITESYNQFNQRIDYIHKLEKHNIVWKEAARLSVIWYCIKFLKCKYSESLNSKIISYE